ncbi:CRE-VPS-41 protein [Caenorhabditis remanei]|uniref:Vacuolar protein sorting-associated protein 41 homolog n=1 Tax=Caenorhabditis remanei TaxID=31234 RepID=E3LE31_CAERE|nr:CRE-VPS-41 protein [Caenorhabditis remanei]
MEEANDREIEPDNGHVNNGGNEFYNAVFDDSNQEDISFNFDEDEEPPLEPRFKYERLEGEHTLPFLKTATFTSIDIHDKFIAIGTASGLIYILDHHGYGNFDSVPPLKPHRCAVSRVKFDETGSYVLSCANDSKLVVSGVGTDKLCCTVNITVMPKSIAFSPDFIRQQSGHCFIMGERNLVLYEKTFFQYKANNLYSGSERDGFIHCCSWNDNFIAFTNDTGTRVYERGPERIVTSVQPSHDVDRVRSSRSPPKHLWMPENNLVIGWADTVTILKIRDDGGVRKGEVHHIFHVSMFICGISYIPENGIENVELFLVGLQLEGEDFDDCASVISTVTTLTAMESTACTTVLKTSVIRPLGLKDFELQSEDVIESIRLSSHTLPYMIHGLGIPYLATYFILTTKQIIIAVPYGPEDGIRWRLQYKLYDEAFEMAKHHADLLVKTDLSQKSVGRKIIEGYLSNKQARVAASYLPHICGDCKEEWEWAVGQFHDAKMSTLLADVLPDSSPTLNSESYETVLIACLFNNPKQFRKLVQTWSPDLYKTSLIIDKTQWRIQQISRSGESGDVDEVEKILMDTLAHLYLYERKYENALKILMSCQDFQIFNVIDKHQLFDLVKDQITELMNINSERALRLLLDNADSVEPAFVMEKIGRQPKLQLAYLTKLMSRNEGTEFADKAVQLYADHDKKKLLPFLRKNANYNVNKARRLCSDRGFVEETIYLLAKSGNHFDAVKMMVREYKNIEKVIAYCKDQNDPDLWVHLLGVVAEFPAHFSQLIIEASNCLDPLLIMDKLPDDADIPNLSEALEKLLMDYTNHADLQKCCYESTLNDLSVLTQNLLQASDESVPVTLMTRCSLCSQIIMASNQELGRKLTDIKVFKCGHVFHLACSTSEIDRRHSIEDGICISCSDNSDSVNV